MTTPTAREVIAEAMCCPKGCASQHDQPCPALHVYRRNIDSILSALAAAGFAVVPIEPTDYMLTAYIGALESSDLGNKGLWHRHKGRKRYMAMIRATSEQGGDDA